MITYEKNLNIDFQIDNLITKTSNEIEKYNIKKVRLLKILEEVCKILENESDYDNPNELLSLLENLKMALEKVRGNSEKLTELSNVLKNLKSSSEKNDDDINKYNELSLNYEKEIFENDIYAENFFNRYEAFMFSFYMSILERTKTNTNTIKEENKIIEKNNTVITNIHEEKGESTNISEEKIEVPDPDIEEKLETPKFNKDESIQNEPSEIQEKDKKLEKNIKVELTDNDTLLISETKGKVFLPYKVNDLNKILKKSRKYNNIEEIIEDKYILPIKRFKNPMFARFKEAFFLMKNKEKAPLSECLGLALEMSVNTYLNPAIITACKSLDELDIYLDYLSDNELEKFKIFKVEYDVLPRKL